MKKNITKLIKIICMFLLVFAIAGGGGYAGYYLASKQETPVSNIDLKKTSTKNENASDFSKMVSEASKNVVEIRTEVVSRSRYMGDYVSEGAGSGVILSEDGYIMTNYHVISGANTIKVTLADGKEYEAELIKGNEANDVALLKIKASGLTPAITGDSDNLVVGEDVVAIGNPLGQLGGTVTEGIISSTSREIDIDGVRMDLLQTSAAINPGNSGGGLFNASGELIGIVNAKSSGSDIEGLGFAIPINQAIKLASSYIK